MKLKSLKIGTVVFRVVEKNRLRGRNGEGKKIKLNGRIRYHSGLIQISKNLSETMQAATIWHEALHGILDQAGQWEHPEALLVALGYGLMQIIRDNPELVAMTRESDG